MRRLFLAGFMIAFVASLLFFTLSLSDSEFWVGGFDTAEFRIKFTDENGFPIRGMELVVKNPEGEISYCYPVTDYNKIKKPISDAKGIMTFHHIYLSPEYGGKCWRLFHRIPIGTCHAPAYMCHFIYLGREIEMIKFSSLYKANKEGESVYELNNKGEKKTILVPWVNEKKLPWDFVEEDESCGNLPFHLNLANHPLPNKVEFPIIKKTIIIRIS